MAPQAQYSKGFTHQPVPTLPLQKKAASLNVTMIPVTGLLCIHRTQWCMNLGGEGQHCQCSAFKKSNML